MAHSNIAAFDHIGMALWVVENFVASILFVNLIDLQVQYLPKIVKKDENRNCN